jgi:hypothetical protein
MGSILKSTSRMTFSVKNAVGNLIVFTRLKDVFLYNCNIGTAIDTIILSSLQCTIVLVPVYSWLRIFWYGWFGRLQAKSPCNW